MLPGFVTAHHGYTPAVTSRPLQSLGYPGILPLMVTVTFPWLARLACGCCFSRVELTTGETWRYWNPCGDHTVLAAMGYQPVGWPPDVTCALEPVPVPS